MSTVTDGTTKFVVTQSLGVLPGTVTAFSGTFKDGYPVDKNTGLVDKKWHLCDGTNGTPDLRQRFILGGDGTNSGTTGGEESVTLTEQTIPEHSHSAWETEAGNHTHTLSLFSSENSNRNNVQQSTSRTGTGSATVSYSGSHTHSITIGNTGGGQPHNNMPPYYVLAYIMKM